MGEKKQEIKLEKKIQKTLARKKRPINSKRKKN